MVRISPAGAAGRYALPTETLDELIDAMGTESYQPTCLRILARYFDADHWALFQYREAGGVCCVASASAVHVAAARSNVQQYIDRCHRVDPALLLVRRQRPESACIAEMAADDIADRQYRQCFEVVGVKERVGFFQRAGGDLQQLSIFRGSRNAALDVPDSRGFSALARVIICSALKHERLACALPGGPPHLALDAIERLLHESSFELSRREIEVCALAAAGRTLEQSARELGIASTSVVTYRKRAYEKLQISRQSELVALINSLRPARA